MDVVPAQTVEAILAGMAARGVDVAAIRARAALPPKPPTLDALWPRSVLGVAWAQALQQFPSPTTPAEVGFAVPFGAFGVIDYLIGSSESVGGALHALVEHFRGIAAVPSFALVDEAEGARLEVLVDDVGPLHWVVEEFSLAVSVANIRHVAAEPVAVTEVCLVRPDPAPGALAAVFGAPVRFGCPVACLCLSPSVMATPTRTADARLRSMMESLAAAMGLGGTTDPFDRAIRARLRDMLPRGDVEASVMARALGMSERTLHRRLQERQTTWRAVIDAFRGDESKRLLRERRRSLAEIALTLGFSEQSTWTRAFRRWTGQSPTRWAQEQ